jgi:DNA-binding winged helix-turn-helix (wHTH) protein
MSKRYIIDSSFEFWPETYQLVAFGAENITISLNMPASRCLELLIEQRFSLVPQNEFYEYVWGEEGHSVSVNTLYQNIALLRKALKSISKKYGVMVLTVTRQGFKLNPIFTVQEKLGEEVIDTTTNIPSEILTDEAPHKEIVLVQANSPSSWWGQDNAALKWLLACLILMLIMTSVILYLSLERKESSPLSHYSLYPDETECTTYANTFIPEVSRRIQMIKELGVDCQKKPYLYITAFNYSTRTSAVACNTPIDSNPPPSCITYNFIGKDIR